MNGTTEEIVDALNLIPHPEGGFFRETFRSGAPPMQSKGLTDASGALMATDRPGTDRNEVTSIIYMLERNHPTQSLIQNVSALIHYWQGGGAITYLLVDLDGNPQEVTLGPKVAEGQRLQLAVPGGWFKGAELEAGAAFGVVGEAVAPGFDFRDLTWVTEAALAERLALEGSDHVAEGLHARLKALVKEAVKVEETAAFYDGT